MSAKPYLVLPECPDLLRRHGLIEVEAATPYAAARKLRREREEFRGQTLSVIPESRRYVIGAWGAEG